DRGQRVGGEDRQREELREERLLHLARGHRPADDRAPDRRAPWRPAAHGVHQATWAAGLARPVCAEITITRQPACLRTYVAVEPSRSRPACENRCSPAITIRLAFARSAASTIAG